MLLASILALCQVVVIENIQPIERNGFFADTIWTSETYIGNAWFVKSL